MKIRIQDLIRTNCVIIDLKQAGKLEVIDSLARFLCSVSGLPNADVVSSKIVERETEMSTGIGYGIAIPHARLPGIDRLYMAAARSAEGIEFDSLDGQAVNLVFMMVSPENTSAEHTQVLSTLSQVMSYEDVRSKLMEADTPEAFVEVIAAAENKYTSIL
ncbi:MAG: PTS sugar transporter subunit IIA [Chitinispirillia bacterium]|nr:PTS sugar transporter subunit IIA [Chitinispirillia bacterium]MCL2268440.1 PTS sugar transporter subunit IIA [Chitinispirillia bacterium]